MRVLLLAYECNPEWFSLPAVAYRYIQDLSEVADVTVVTQIKNKENIEKVGGIGKAEIVYIDNARVVDFFDGISVFLRGGHERNIGFTILVAFSYPSYIHFEWMVMQKFKDQLKEGTFDLVHRLTPMTPTLPSPMAKWSPVPFVIGPLNGGLKWPQAFKTEQRREREWLSDLREAYRLMPFYKTTYEKSSAVLAAFDHTVSDLPKYAEDKIVNFPEVGIDPALFNKPNRLRREKMTVLFAGRLVPYKLPEVVVRAFAQSPILQQHRLVIVGDGPEKPKLEQIVAEKHLENCVEILGRQPHKVVGQLMQESEIFAFPSIRELGAGVVIEAMACGMTCLVVDYGGCGGLVGPDRGVKVPLGSFDEIVNSFVKELEQLVTDPDRVAALGEAAFKHAFDFYPWKVKAQKNVEAYQWALGQRSKKPDFWEESVLLAEDETASV